MTDGTIAAEKQAARRDAFARRKAAHGLADAGAARAHLLAHLREFAGQVVSGYMPIRTEIDIVPAMAALCAQGPVCVPIVLGEAQPLVFHKWTPDTPMKAGAFGAPVPRVSVPLVPQVIILPLLAFDARGYRLGYGGGFYDRTLQQLRALAPVHTIGFAYGAQEMAKVPIEPTDQKLDALVTENGLTRFAGA